MSPRKYPPVAERLAAKTLRGGPDDCWPVTIKAQGSKPHRPWSDPGCAVCGSPDTATLSNQGRRCAADPPTFDATYAVELMRGGFPDTAGAYVRTEYGGAV